LLAAVGLIGGKAPRRSGAGFSRLSIAFAGLGQSDFVPAASFPRLPPP